MSLRSMHLSDPKRMQYFPTFISDSQIYSEMADKQTSYQAVMQSSRQARILPLMNADIMLMDTDKSSTPSVHE
jgi:hypothetical protein